ncbi:MAG: hypothetical protein M1483_08885 [Actinobacteria bacterium]|nr:hypothetical protein [Actinomycetota bacterium]MCL6105718.1 hypothetical protein [Actinomycetota bacterium]
MTKSRQEKITPYDIEAKLNEINYQLQGKATAVKPQLYKTGIIVVAAFVIVAYLLGRRKGRLRSTVVEIKRV